MANTRSGTDITDQLINPTNSVQEVIYHFKARIKDIRPGHEGFFCDQGGDTSITVYVLPTPRFSISVADTIVCDSTTITIDVTDLNGPVLGDKVYDLTTLYMPGTITGVQPNGQYSITTDIIDQLVNQTNQVQSVSYHLRYRYNDSRNAGLPFCDHGIDTTITIYVQPTPRLSIAVTDTIVCDSTIITIAVEDMNGQVHNSSTKVYMLTTTNPGGVLNVQPDGEYNAGEDISDQLINITNSVQPVTYHFKARIRDDRPGHEGFFCDQGGDTLVIIYVEPTPRVNGSVSSDTICNKTSVTYTLSSPTLPYFGAGSLRFNVNVVSLYPEVSGYSDNPGLNLSSAITETLTNTGDTARMIMYIIRPSTTNILGVQNCPGISDTIRVWINPTPRAAPVNLKPAICYGETTQIVLESPTVMTKGDISFDYWINFTGGTSIEGNSTPDTDLATGQTLAFPYTNDGDTIHSVYFSILPKNDLSGCVPGDTVFHQVRVHPHPLDTMYLSTAFTCSGGSEGVLTAILSRGSKPDSIHWHRPSFLGDTIYYTSANTTEIGIQYAGLYSVTVHDSLKCTQSINPLFISGAIFQSILAVDNYPTGYGTTCPGASDGRILILEDASSTGIPPYEFWLVRNHTDTVSHDTLFATNVIYTVNNLSAGIYTLFLKDVNDCYNGIYPEIEIYEPPEISVTFDKQVYPGGDNVSCRGYNDGHVWISSISGGNPGGYKYKWFNYEGKLAGIPDTLDRLDNIPAGTYYLRSSDIYCEKWDSVTLTEPDGMILSEYKLSYTVDSAYNISCYGGNDGSIDLTITGGSGDFTYYWTDSASFSSTSEDISNLKAGTYVCEIKDVNGCILKLPPGSTLPAFTLTEPLPLHIEPVLSNSTAGPYNINCNGGTGSITITVSGGSAGSYNYTWSASDGGSGLVAGQEDQLLLTAGTYNLEVIDLYGCVVLFDTTLTEPAALAASLVASDITCASPGLNNGSINLTVTGGEGPYTYLWSNGATTEDISGLTPDDYSVVVLDANSCEYYDTVSVNLPPPITFTRGLSDHNGYNISCNGSSDGQIDITMTSGLAPYIFSWTGPGGYNATSEDITGLRAGQYTLLITDANLCTASDVVDLTEPGELSMILTLSSSTAGGYNINCAGDSTGSIEVTPVNQAGNVAYLWSDGNTSATRTNIPAGNYGLIITDANGCLADTSIYLTEPDSIVLEFAVTQPFCPDKPDGTIVLTVTGGVVGTDYTYLWSDNSTTKDLSDIPAGWYSVTVSDLNGCSVSDSVNVEAQNEMCLIIPNGISPNGDLINDVWNIGLSELYPEIEIQIFNRWGEAIWRSEKGYPDPWDGRSRGRQLPVDSYHYIIDLHNGTKPIIGNITIVR